MLIDRAAATIVLWLEMASLISHMVQNYVFGRYKKTLKLRVFLSGTSGRTRTDTLARATDFESVMSTNSITLAKFVIPGSAGLIPKAAAV